MVTRTLLSAGLLLPLSACTSLVIENEIPKAEIAVLVGGTPVSPTVAIPYMGSPVAVTLNGSGSSDEDGEIVKHLWVDADRSIAQRCEAMGIDEPACKANPPSLEGDFGNQATVQVMLEEGTHSFALWVTDNEGLISAPASVTLTVETPSVYMPDATCLAAFMDAAPSMTCAECVCTPTAMEGCLDAYNNCFANTNDPMGLCAAIMTCASEKGCSGSACYAPNLCQAEIDAAAMAANITALECGTADPTMSPCTAASQFTACFRTENCMAACM